MFEMRRRIYRKQPDVPAEDSGTESGYVFNYQRWLAGTLTTDAGTFELTEIKFV